MSTNASETPATVNGTYEIDPAHSQVGFAVRHAMVTKVRGAFGEYSGSGHFDAETPARSQLELVIQVSSVDTRNADRDAHLLSGDFFDAETYPEIRFTSSKVEGVGDGRFAVTGDLTIKDVARPVTVDFEYLGVSRDPFGNDRIGFEGSAVVNRKDWGLTWNTALDTGGVLVSEKVTLEFEVSAVRA